MSPLRSMARQIAWLARACLASVVRMKASLEYPIGSARPRKFRDTLSTKVRGSRPASCADFSTFWPCSSVPVRNITSYPSSRLKRASTSHASVV